jgi:hypothetical protein
VLFIKVIVPCGLGKSTYVSVEGLDVLTTAVVESVKNAELNIGL